ENNHVYGVRCGRNSADYYREAVGIFMGAMDQYSIYRNNDVHSFQSDNDCYAAISPNAMEAEPNGVGNLAAGIYCDTGSNYDIVEDNTIHDQTQNLYTGPLTHHAGASGIYWESTCNYSEIRTNVVYNLRSNLTYGLLTGSSSCAANHDNHLYN